VGEEKTIGQVFSVSVFSFSGGPQYEVVKVAVSLSFSEYMLYIYTCFKWLWSYSVKEHNYQKLLLQSNWYKYSMSYYLWTWTFLKHIPWASNLLIKELCGCMLEATTNAIHRPSGTLTG